MALYLFEPLLPSVAVSRRPFQCIAKTGRKCRDESVGVEGLAGYLLMLSRSRRCHTSTFVRHAGWRQNTHSSTRSAQRNGVQWGDIAGTSRLGAVVGLRACGRVVP